MHIPIATKGYENLFVALAKRERVDGSTLCSSVGCIRCAPKTEYLICTLAQHSPKKSFCCCALDHSPAALRIIVVGTGIPNAGSGPTKS